MTFIQKLLFTFFLLFSFTLSGQNYPPNFLCVSNDTLMWESPMNACGPFNAYEIYGSTNQEGPYTLLMSETDPAQTSYFNANVNNQTWYYYLVTNADCPAEVTIFSDTLDNQIPIADDIQNVTVVPGGVEINWYPSPSPEVTAYVVSRNTTLGTTDLAVVSGGLTTYLDTTADPQNMSETYFVVAVDPCDNKSLVVNPHSTIFLTVTPPDACQSGVVLNWNAYENWQEGVDHYDIFVSVNGDTENLVGEATATANTFTYMEANDGENLCFRIEAVENISEVRSSSSTACTDVNIFQPIRNIELLGASVNPDGSVDLEWFWDETALVATADVLNYRVGDDVILSEALPLSVPLSQSNTLTNMSVNAQTAAYVFNIEAVDDCDNQVNSNDSQSPFLSGTPQGETSNLLTWDAYTHDLATAISYELVNVTAMGENVIFTSGAFDTKFTDELILGGADPAENCYYLRVLVEYTLADGQVLNRVLRSNTVCIVPAPQVYVPNVFAPNSVNNKFRPFLSFNAPSESSMDVFDRWGAHVFSTKDISAGWNGKRNNELMPQGVYLYIIEIQPEGGDAIKLTGDVMLLH